MSPQSRKTGAIMPWTRTVQAPNPLAEGPVTTSIPGVTTQNLTTGRITDQLIWWTKIDLPLAQTIHRDLEPTWTASTVVMPVTVMIDSQVLGTTTSQNLVKGRISPSTGVILTLTGVNALPNVLKMSKPYLSWLAVNCLFKNNTIDWWLWIRQAFLDVFRQ